MAASFERGLWDEFVWFHDKDGCELRSDPGRPPDPNPTGLLDLAEQSPTTRMQRVSDLLVDYHPHKEFPGLFREFADIERTEQAACDFISRYGFLGGRFHPNARRIISESVKQVLSVQLRMKFVVLLLDTDRTAFAVTILRGESKPLVQETIDDTNPNRLMPVALPLTLEGLLWLQVRDALVEGRRFKKCKWEDCPHWFPIGRGAGTKRKLFCDDSCRVAWHRRHPGGE